MLEIIGLTKKFKGREVLSDISLAMDNGVYGLLGSNGSGKTTLLRCIALLYPESKKTVFYNNTPAAFNKNYLNKIGYLPQNFGLFYDLSVEDALLLLANFKGISKAEAKNDVEYCLDLVNLSEQKNKKIRTLSGGMLRRIGIAQTFLNDPDIIVFDEPTTGLDPEERLRFKSIISKQRKDKIIIISTHIVDDIETVCEKVIVIDKGKVKANTSCKALAEFAENKVFELPETELCEVNGEYYVKNLTEKNGTTVARILTKDMQSFQATQPTVEDGYLCILKDI